MEKKSFAKFLATDSLHYNERIVAAIPERWPKFVFSKLLFNSLVEVFLSWATENKNKDVSSANNFTFEFKASSKSFS